jgi:catechol 2,3-dioxygenase-like lactoylglutathione lyase family enzyme
VRQLPCIDLPVAQEALPESSVDPRVGGATTRLRGAVWGPRQPDKKSWRATTPGPAITSRGSRQARQDFGPFFCPCKTPYDISYDQAIKSTICSLARRWNCESRIAKQPARQLILLVGRRGGIMTVKRMDNVGIVVEDIDAAVEFFTELGLQFEGRAPIEGDWVDGVTGLRDMRVEIAMMRTPDGHSRLELSRFLRPPVVADHRYRPGELSRLPARHVHRGGHRRYARPPRKTRRGDRRQSGPVPRHLSALLHPGTRRNSHRACPRARAADFPMSPCDRYRPDRMHPRGDQLLFE